MNSLTSKTQGKVISKRQAAAVRRKIREGQTARLCYFERFLDAEEKLVSSCLYLIPSPLLDESSFFLLIACTEGGCIRWDGAGLSKFDLHSAGFPLNLWAPILDLLEALDFWNLRPKRRASKQTADPEREAKN